MAVVLALVAAGPVLAQNGEFCAIPEGCDLDGDGVVDVPSGAPVPTEDQYGAEEEFCAIPEGCEASAPPDPDDGSAPPDPVEVPASPVPGDASAPADGGSASVPAGSIADAGAPAAETTESTKAGAGPATSASPAPAASPHADNLEVLPETGGPSVPVLALGALLAAGGLTTCVLRRKS